MRANAKLRSIEQMAITIPKVSPPKNLKDLQRLTAAAVRQPLDSEYNARANWYDGSQSTASVAESFIKPNDRLTSLERLEIYNKQYWFRLLDILYDDYPGLRAILGESTYHEMSQAYLEKYPSKSFTLRNLGSKLPKFLAEQPQWGGRRQRMLLDMADFEWAQVVAFDGPSKPMLPPAVLAKSDPNKLKLGLQPYLTLLDMAYPLDEYLIAVKRQARALRGEASNAVESPTKKKKLKPIPPPRAKRTCLVVHRHDNMLYYKRLEPTAFAILKNLQAGQPLAAACEAAVVLKKKPITPAKIGLWFREWTELGWLCER